MPKGYVEPKKPEPKPVATMASKLKIDVNSTAPSTRSASASGAEDAESAFEAFVGGGRTLNGRRTKGKGLQRSIEEVEKESKIFRTEYVAPPLAAGAAAAIAIADRRVTPAPSALKQQEPLHPASRPRIGLDRQGPRRAQPAARAPLLWLDVQGVRARPAGGVVVGDGCGRSTRASNTLASVACRRRPD